MNKLLKTQSYQIDSDNRKPKQTYKQRLNLKKKTFYKEVSRTKWLYW